MASFSPSSNEVWGDRRMKEDRIRQDRDDDHKQRQNGGVKEEYMADTENIKWRG
jgi:hypothetical protein